MIKHIGLCLQDAHDLFDVFTTTLDEETSRAHRTPSVFDLSAIQVLSQAASSMSTLMCFPTKNFFWISSFCFFCTIDKISYKLGMFLKFKAI